MSLIKTSIHKLKKVTNLQNNFLFTEYIKLQGIIQAPI